MHFLFNGESRKLYAHRALNTGCHRPVATRMEDRHHPLSPLDIKVLWAICAHIYLSKPASSRMELSKKQRETIMAETSGHFGCKAEAYLFLLLQLQRKSILTQNCHFTSK